ncbi:MAG: GNAT family N-acetyltransferase [Candidatus Eremiobacteraeota bacterium]|nr:GNAT family N-acetyltransferase [Candidatus Eremiobacteraeota bacterium]
MSVTLRAWRRGDEEALVELADNPNVARYMTDGFPSPYTPSDAQAWISRNEAANPKTHFAILVDGNVVGGIGFTLFGGERRGTAYIGYWIGEPYWGRGFATTALREATKVAFDQHKLHRLEAPAYAPNVASHRVLENAGYLREGIMRKAVVKHGEFLDAYLYAIVR